MDETRARDDLRRMKAFAAGLLVLAAVVYLLARWGISSGNHIGSGGSAATAGDGAGWLGYVRAGAEAAMVGALADWFAVTALFRHPLGLPIPHTAIIPTRKDRLGEGLGAFVGTHFLSAPVVRERLRTFGPAARAGHWLCDPAHAARVTDEAATVVRGAVGVLRDDDVRAVLEQAVLPRLLATPVAPPVGRLLDTIIRDGAHRGTVQLLVDRAVAWLGDNEAVVVDAVSRQAPAWSPRLVDDAVATRVYRELVRVAGLVQADQDHPVRRSLDRLLLQTAQDLQHDLETIHRGEQLRAALLARTDVRSAVGDLSTAVRTALLDAIEDPDSELRRRATAALTALGARLVEDDRLRATVDGWAEGVVVHVVTNYRDELTSTITDTIGRWDGQETARRVELAVGRDLQYIRINGTIVGALAGLAIHAMTQLLF